MIPKKTFEQFLTDEQAEADRQIKELGATAKYTLINNGDLADFHDQMEEILTNIRG